MSQVARVALVHATKSEVHDARLPSASPGDVAIQLSGRAHQASHGPGGPKSVSAETWQDPSESEKPALGAGFAQAADGTRTHDLPLILRHRLRPRRRLGVL